MNSPFQSILNTNTVPSDAECDEIRALLRPQRPRLAHLNDQVARLQVILDDAVRARDELQAAIKAHEALISPMRRVPDDILSVIFLHTLPTTRETALSRDEGPLLLMQVCQYWRALTLAVPRLWSSMHIALPPKNSDPALQLFGLKSEVERWTRRAAAVPLSIRVHASRKRYPIAPPSSGDSPPSILVESLLPVAHQWGMIHLKVDDVRDLSVLDKVTPLDAKHLNRFSITLSRSALGATGYRLPMLGAPALRQLAYQGRDNCIPATPIWRNLVRLTLSLSRGSSETDHQVLPFPFLAECTALQTLHLSFTRMSFQYGKTVCLPRLQEIHLGEWITTEPDIGTLSQLLARLDMPNLKRLGLHQMGGPVLGPLRYLGPACSAAIQWLSIPAKQLDGPSIREMLGPMTGLVHLRLVAPSAFLPDVAQTFLVCLTPTDEDPTGDDPSAVLCPNLEVLELAGPSTLSDEYIIQFLRARAAHPETMPLRQFKAVLSRAQQGDLRSELADLVQDRLQLVLVYRPTQPYNRVRCSPLEGTERDPTIVKVKKGEEWLQEADPMRLD
ncbi:hypothetical protein HMN09_00918000 [Mycena chlorophos]|uniref:F-box domain-containing protein n=1 Tax=Mycena chlorophos TaxID=658473 RepID=A0A8H6W0C9_MYCCL|nr:hypothetical protein HMN09_00918000 [Mycena chlorophos]